MYVIGNSGKLGETRGHGKLGDGRDVPHYFPKETAASNASISCAPRSTLLHGRPPFWGSKRRNVACSSDLINSAEPKGRPVCVLPRMAARSASVSSAPR